MSELYNVKEMAKDLFDLLRLTITPIGIKLLEKEEDIAKIERCRRVPEGVCYTGCQVFGQAMNMGYTIALTKNIIPIANCDGIHGFRNQDQEWHDGQDPIGIWYAEPKDGVERQKHTPYIPYGKYEAIVASPLSAGRMEPDVCMIVAKPAQIFFLLSGYLRHDYAPLDTPICGESSCSSHWVRTALTGKPNISLPCFAELRFAQYPEDCMIFTLTPAQLKKAIDGAKELQKIGLKYPVPGYGVITDARAGHDKSYKK